MNISRPEKNYVHSDMEKLLENLDNDISVGGTEY